MTPLDFDEVLHYHSIKLNRDISNSFINKIDLNSIYSFSEMEFSLF